MVRFSVFSLLFPAFRHPQGTASPARAAGPCRASPTPETGHCNTPYPIGRSYVPYISMQFPWNINMPVISCHFMSFLVISCYFHIDMGYKSVSMPVLPHRSISRISRFVWWNCWSTMIHLIKPLSGAPPGWESSHCPVSPGSSWHFAVLLSLPRCAKVREGRHARPCRCVFFAPSRQGISPIDEHVGDWSNDFTWYQWRMDMDLRWFKQLQGASDLFGGNFWGNWDHPPR